MTRAERRRIEKEQQKRQERINKFKVVNGKMLLSAEDFRWIKSELKKEAQEEVTEELRDEIYAQAVEDNAEFMNYCFAMSLHREYGFGAKRIVRVLDGADAIFGKLANHEIEYEDLKAQLEEEAKLTIRMDGDEQNDGQ